MRSCLISSSCLGILKRRQGMTDKENCMLTRQGRQTWWWMKKLSLKRRAKVDVVKDKDSDKVELKANLLGRLNTAKVEVKVKLVDLHLNNAVKLKVMAGFKVELVYLNSTMKVNVKVDLVSQ